MKRTLPLFAFGSTPRAVIAIGNVASGVIAIGGTLSYGVIAIGRGLQIASAGAVVAALAR